MFSVALSGTAEPNKLIDKRNSLNCRQPAQAHPAILYSWQRRKLAATFESASCCILPALYHCTCYILLFGYQGTLGCLNIVTECNWYAQIPGRNLNEWQEVVPIDIPHALLVWWWSHWHTSIGHCSSTLNVRLPKATTGRDVHDSIHIASSCPKHGIHH